MPSAGRDWVLMADALARVEAEELGKPQAEVMATFKEAIWEPLLHHLDRLRVEHTLDVEPGTALRSLEKYAKDLSATKLGAEHTAEAMRRLGVETGDRSWSEAREAVLRRDTAGPPHQRDVSAWIAYSIHVKLADLQASVDCTGRKVSFNPTQPATGRLPPLVLDHSRAGHAERVALERLLSELSSAEAALRRELLQRPTSARRQGCEATVPAELRGSVQLFAGHTPCLSCIAVFVQFQRQVPDVKLSVAFEDSRRRATEIM